MGSSADVEDVVCRAEINLLSKLYPLLKLKYCVIQFMCRSVLWYVTLFFFQSHKLQSLKFYSCLFVTFQFLK